MSSLDNIFHQFAQAFRGVVRNEGKEVAFVEELGRPDLDGSVASLLVVDRYLTTLHARGDTIPEDAWHATVLWGGAYVGEVIRLTVKLPRLRGHPDYAASRRDCNLSSYSTGERYSMDECLLCRL